MECCLGEEKILGLFNFSEHDRTAQIDESDLRHIDLLTGESREAGEVSLSAYGYCYLK